MAEQKTETLPDIIPGFGNLQSFELAQRAATLLSKSTLVPKDYQNNLPNCVIALNMASRMNADPLMVMQNLYIVHGRPGWSSQFLISTFNTCGRFTAIRYDWTGAPGSEDRGCTAWATEKLTGEKLMGSMVNIKLAKAEGWYAKNGSKWQTMPDQMLMYRAASFFVRTYAPELAMGMHTEEEIIDMTPNEKGTYESSVAADIAKNANVETIDITPTAETVKEPENPFDVVDEPIQPAKPAGPSF
jgi:hypothetical protein